MHCFNGCDTVSAFVRRGKITPLKALQKYSDFIEVFECLGKDEQCSDILLDDLEEFVCRMYGKPSYTSENKLRYDSLSQKYQGTSGQVLSALILVFFLLAEHHWKCILKEPIISHSYGVFPLNSFQMCQALKDMVGKLMRTA